MNIVSGLIITCLVGAVLSAIIADSGDARAVCFAIIYSTLTHILWTEEGE